MVRKKRLDQARWNYLSEMESNHYFDLEKLDQLRFEAENK
jgi:hypothetical protein